jgi:hypothetical protein
MRIHSRNLLIIILFPVSMLVFFFDLRSQDLLVPDEIRYAVITREMRQSGNGVLHYLNREIYAKKSPPFFWMVKLGQQSIVYTSKNVVIGWIKSVYKIFTIGMGARLGYRRRFLRSEDWSIILYIFIVVWGIAIISILGVILYQIIIKPLLKKRK